MSIATDLRNLASRADKVQEAFARLHFCATVHIIAMKGTDSREIQRTLDQLNEAVNATAATSCR
jgi:hypothetical protein